jgi:hypothetical protein
MPFVTDPSTGYQVWQEPAATPASTAKKAIKASGLTGSATAAPAAFSAPAAPKIGPQGSTAFNPQLGAITQASLNTTLTGSAPRATTAPRAPAPQTQNIDQAGIIKSGITQPGSLLGGPGAAFSDPGNNMANPGYTEQAFLNLQNRFMEDPAAGMLQDQYGNSQKQSAGEKKLNQSLGALDGPGQGDQYWNQVQGQFMDPFSGEQFTRGAAQNFAPTGAAGAFNQQAQGQYQDFTGFTGPGNTQGQYGASAGELAGGTAGEAGLGQIAGQYGSIGQYGDPNRAAGQYEQTQQAFGDLPIAEFDPFYDRARQLATQDYNRQSAGRGVYGSSEALSGVGNVITDIEAQRANRSFDAEMQRSVEQRNRQALLGEQARMGDLSGLGAFGANLAGAETFAGINEALGNQQLDRNRLMGDLANQADSQALGAQNANIAGLGTLGDIAGRASGEETDRFRASTDAALGADRLGLDRMTSGADVAFGVDEGNRRDFDSTTRAASDAAGIELDRNKFGADVAQTLGQNDFQRLQGTMGAASQAEGDRQGRQNSQIDATMRQTEQMLSSLGTSMEQFFSGSEADFERRWEAEMLPMLQAADMDQKQIDQTYQVFKAVGEAYAKGGGG